MSERLEHADWVACHRLVVDWGYLKGMPEIEKAYYAGEVHSPQNSLHDVQICTLVHRNAEYCHLYNVASRFA